MGTKGLFFTILLLAFSSVSIGQTVRQKTAKRQLEDLKNGVLIVRLSTNSRTIKAMESTIMDSETSSSSKTMIREQLAQRIHDRDSVNQGLKDYFGGDTYTFSDVYFMYDTSQYRLKNMEPSGYFYDQFGNLSDTMTLEGKTYFMTFIGRTDQSTGTNTQAFVIHDKFGNIPDYPFPGYITFRKGLSQKKRSKKREKNPGIFKGYTLEDVVRKVNDTMNWTYKRAQVEW